MAEINRRRPIQAGLYAQHCEGGAQGSTGAAITASTAVSELANAAAAEAGGAADSGDEQVPAAEPGSRQWLFQYVAGLGVAMLCMGAIVLIGARWARTANPGLKPPE